MNAGPAIAGGAAVRALPFGRAAILFALPSGALAAAIYVTIPWTLARGVPLALAVPAQFLAVLGVMGGAAWVLARREAGAGVLDRLRLRAPGLAQALLGLLLGAFMLASYRWLSFTAGWMFARVPLAPPAWLEEFSTPTHLLGIPLAGNPWPVLLYFVIYLFNVMGEELWWRGYILPRQVARHGGSAWVVHGLLWVLFHWFFYWDLVALVPGALALSFVAQRTGNTWTAVIGHAILNGAAFVRIIGGVVAA